MRSISLAFVLLTMTAAPALAQKPTRLPFIVVDARGALAKLGTDQTTATDLGVATTRQPATGLGVTLGVNAYPIRWYGVAIGIGGEWMAARSLALNTEVTEDIVGPAILERRLNGWSGLLSVNFGGRDGWSYLSGGAGPLRFETTSSAVAHTTPPSRMTQNFGGGARWFTTSRVAAGFDVRFYLTRPQAGTATTAGRDRKRVLVFAVGISIR